MCLFYLINAFIHFEFLSQGATPVGIATIHSVFNIFATIILLPFGKDLYEKNGVSVRTEVENAKKQIDGSNPKILLLRAASKNIKAKGSDGIVSGEILKDLGCVNIADSDSSLLDDLSLEAIVKEDPDFIFVTIQGTHTEAVSS